MLLLRIAIASAIPLLFSACASTKVELENSKFLTRIAQSDLKHFEVRLRNRQERSQSTPNLENRQNRPREPRVDVERVKRTLAAYAKAHIELNKYCREGFWVMQVDAYSPVVSLRGECNESATDADRKAFPDTIGQW